MVGHSGHGGHGGCSPRHHQGHHHRCGWHADAFRHQLQVVEPQPGSVDRGERGGLRHFGRHGPHSCPWYDSLCSQLPGVLGPGVFSNGALVLKGDEVFHASVLPAETVATVVECLVDGRVHGRKIGALAVVAADGFEYSELAPEGPTWVTRLIQRAGEPVTPRGSWNPWLLQREVHKFVMFTAPDDPSWAAMDQVVPLLREKLATSATVLDCGAKQCEILPPGENKGTASSGFTSRNRGFWPLLFESF